MSPDAPVSLALPFGAIGLVGGWLTADSLHLQPPHDAPRFLLAGVTPITAALLGSYLTKRIGGVGGGGAATSSAGAGAVDGARLVGAGWMEGPGRWTRRGPIVASLLAVWAIGVAGVVNGMTIGLMVGPAGMIIGAAFGAVFSLPFIPALAVVLLAANRVGRARAGSIVASADRRAVWAATASVIAVAALGAGALFGAPVAPELGRAAAAMGLAVVGALFVVDAAALARVLRLPRGPMGAAAGGERGDAGEVEVEVEATGTRGDSGAGRAWGEGRASTSVWGTRCSSRWCGRPMPTGERGRSPGSCGATASAPWRRCGQGWRGAGSRWRSGRRSWGSRGGDRGATRLPAAGGRAGRRKRGLGERGRGIWLDT
ncbi:hypothetical protein WME76_06420 [Sorangium sp. So ce119]|uniref:hypothetical protein n=1 Tax=Sorangium sp. So ce119 TaxID=3133279 RepID=UPI003F6199B1